VAEELRGHGHEVCLLISRREVDREGARKYRELRFEELAAVAKPSTMSPRMLPFLWRLWQSVGHCKRLLLSLRADAVLGMGGFTSLPPVYAGHRLRLRTYVHDSNALPGRANRLTSRFCTKVLVGMEAAAACFGHRPVVVTGTPVRLELRELPTRAAAAAALGLDAARPVWLVMGGSQGARRLNELAPEAARRLPPEWQVLHIAGGADEARVRAASAGRNEYRVLGFCDRMADAYAVADLALSRAGASSLTELAHAGLPSLLVPYPYAADDHQTRNAEVYERAGAAKLVQERDLDAGKLAAMVISVLGDLQTRAGMAQAARDLAVPNAAARVREVIEANAGDKAKQ
jgi:UDP-N-acetylglucosamine--N-acetylmuramyl-(pentapeptide) pyrophosphoryl-undecaprenol N-acetylglucosamine transferase